MTHRHRVYLGLTLAALVLVLDQGTKAAVLGSPQLQGGGVIQVVPGLFDLVFTWNFGMTFGLFRYVSAWIVLIPVALAVIGALLVWLVRSERSVDSCAIGAILGGALGNVMDRAHYGKVADFLHLHLGSSDPFPYIFNVGDAAIVIGVFTLMLDMLLPHGKQRQAITHR